LSFADDNDSVSPIADGLSSCETKKVTNFSITTFFFSSFPLLLSHSFLISARLRAANIAFTPTHDAKNKKSNIFPITPRYLYSPLQFGIIFRRNYFIIIVKLYF
jgi:hypothetical protein